MQRGNSKTKMKEIKKIVEKDKFHYDTKYDMLYLKLNDFDYDKSFEINNLILDFDERKRMTGIEILDAADFLNVSKQILASVKKWFIKVSLEDGKIYLNMEFEFKQGNKTYVRNPIIVESLNAKASSAETVCAIGCY